MKSGCSTTKALRHKVKGKFQNPNLEFVNSKICVFNNFVAKPLL